MCDCDQGVTLPERRQSSCALKLRVGQTANEIRRARFKYSAECRAQDETLALVPSFLQAHTLIDAIRLYS